MAVVNGLDALAITDHNSSYNIPAAMEIAAAYGIVLVPGMELETSEEIHIVCLFPDYPSLTAFQKIVCDSYSPRDNVVEIFGHQHIYNSDDEITGEWEPLLLEPTGISIDDVFRLADEVGGIAYPAHVDRDSYSVLSICTIFSISPVRPVFTVFSRQQRDKIFQCSGKPVIFSIRICLLNGKRFMLKVNGLINV